MCYEYSSWFHKARVKEIDKAREKAESEKRPAADTATPRPAEQAPRVRESEKLPA